jgi:ribonuclease P protein component
VRVYESLRGRREFAIVLRRGRAASNKHIVVFALVPKRTHAPRTRSVERAASRERVSTKVGIVITKKVGTAVQRNRLRRRCKAILDNAVFGASPTWYVVQFRPSAAGLSFAQLREQLATLLEGAVRVAGEVRRRRETTRS